MFTFYALKTVLLTDVATCSYLISPHLTFPYLISASEVITLILRHLLNKKLLFPIESFQVLSPLYLDIEMHLGSPFFLSKAFRWKFKKKNKQESSKYFVEYEQVHTCTHPHSQTD